MYVMTRFRTWAPVLIGLRSANASVTADGTRMVVSNLTGFDIYALETMESEGSLSHTVGDVYPVPVLFVHGGTAILGGSTVGEVELWNVITRRKHLPLRLRGTYSL